MKKHFVQADDVKIAVYTWGDEPSAENPREIIVLAHGFPDRAVFWQDVASALQNEYFVVAYDMRGCGDSTPIRGTKHYRYAPLLSDLYAVIDNVSAGQKVHLVGHDWGGIYGWEAIVDQEGTRRIASFTTQSPSLEQAGFFLRRRAKRPTPRNLLQLFSQLLRNSLMTFFTLPILPELLWRSGLGVAFMRMVMAHYEPGATYQKYDGVEGDAIRYLGIYRANLLQRALNPKKRISNVPVHCAISVNDPFLPPSVFEDCANWTSDYSASEINAAHWAPLSQPRELAKSITAHVKRYPAIRLP